MPRTARLRRRLDGNAGFTLIELTVAMFVTLTVVTGLVGVFVKSLSGVALAKERQAATALATGVMEQFRAVDYGTLSAGMYCDDLAGDPNVVIVGPCGAGGSVTFQPGISGISEPVKVQLGSAPAPVRPLSPQVVQETRENVTYDVASYVTSAATTQESFQLTVLVSWSSNVSAGEKTVIQRSLSYSPSRCLSSATHPYAGACQAAFRGDAGTTTAGIRIVEAGGTGGEPFGLGGAELSLSLPTLSATTAVEQISKLTGSVGTSGSSFTDGSATTGVGADVGTASADTDPSSVDATDASDTAAQPSQSPVTSSGTVGTLSSRPWSADTGSASAWTSVPGTQCLDTAGTPLPATGLACTIGDIKAHGSDATIDLDLAGTLPGFTVARMSAAPSASRAVVSRLTSAGTTACPSASGLGCVTSMVRRTLGTVELGGLPANSGDDALPEGWNGFLVGVTGVDESASAESGFGARGAPGFIRHGGTLEYYNEATDDYTSVPLADLSADLDVTLPVVNGTWVDGGQTYTVSVSGTLRAGGTGLLAPSVTAPDPDCKTAACESSATVASTLVADLVYEVQVGTGTPARFAVVADLGAPLARSSYKAAFDA